MQGNRIILLSGIKDFKCKETEFIFNGLFSKKLSQDIQRLAERKFIMIHRAAKINDLKVPPANCLETLSTEMAKMQLGDRLEKEVKILNPAAI